MFQKGRLPGRMRKRLDQKSPEERAYMEQMLKIFGIGGTDMGFIQKKSIRNQFCSDLVTPLEDNISVSGTTVHIFYAVKMGGKYEARYRQHFKDPDIRRHDTRHEELLVCVVLFVCAVRGKACLPKWAAVFNIFIIMLALSLLKPIIVIPGAMNLGGAGMFLGLYLCLRKGEKS